jgi:hypothetical protein
MRIGADSSHDLDKARCEMQSIYKTIERIAARAIGMLKVILIQRIRIGRPATAKVIEFYIPKSYRKPRKWNPADRGTIIEFCPKTRRSA